MYDEDPGCIVESSCISVRERQRGEHPHELLSMVFSELTLLKVGSWRVLSALCRICVCLCMHLCACVNPAHFTT